MKAELKRWRINTCFKHFIPWSQKLPRRNATATHVVAQSLWTARTQVGSSGVTATSATAAWHVMLQHVWTGTSLRRHIEENLQILNVSRSSYLTCLVVNLRRAIPGEAHQDLFLHGVHGQICRLFIIFLCLLIGGPSTRGLPMA